MSIPKRIILTYKSNDINNFPPTYKQCYDKIQEYLGDEYEIIIFLDKDADNMIKDYDEKLFKLYEQQRIIVKTDIFRLVALYTLGGYYMDLDLLWIQSPKELFNEINKYNKETILCVEKNYLPQVEYFYKDLGDNPKSLANYFMASRKGSIFIKKAIDYIIL